MRDECFYANIWNTLRHKDQVDLRVEGVWTGGVLKFNTTLWRARWGKIQTRSEWAKRQITEVIDYVLCGDPMESQPHLFFLCD